MNIGGSSAGSFQGQGSTDRSESFKATVPAVVTKVLSNGNLFVEGHRAILVNSEEHHFYISGVVRPIDIDQQNSMKSSVVADAQIEFIGRGDLSDNQKQGWLSRYLGWMWPMIVTMRDKDKTMRSCDHATRSAMTRPARRPATPGPRGR